MMVSYRNQAEDNTALGQRLALVIVASYVAFVLLPLSGGDWRRVDEIPSTPWQTLSLGETVPEPTARAKGPLDPVDVSSIRRIEHLFAEANYTIDAVRAGTGAVPRFGVLSLPPDMHEVREPERRKAVFLQTVLPLVLHANEDILQDRRTLKRLQARVADGGILLPNERLFLDRLAEGYETASDDFETLLRRVDVVPPSVALAQAAVESGWGTSRFAHQGNALFGQWTWNPSNALVPEERAEGASHGVRAFDTTLASTRAYMRNLNTHSAYHGFRLLRGKIRLAGGKIEGRRLLSTLTGYSERGREYVQDLNLIMDQNQLARFDDAKLAPAGSEATLASNAMF